MATGLAMQSVSAVRSVLAGWRIITAAIGYCVTVAGSMPTRWMVILPDVAPVSDASPDPTSQQAQGGQCAVSVYWDADFKGERWDTEQNQRYVGNHWNDQISSIRVISGTWRFYWDADYSGEMIELKPGEYHYVGGHWNDQISSFRCVTSRRNDFSVKSGIAKSPMCSNRGCPKDVGA